MINILIDGRDFVVELRVNQPFSARLAYPDRRCADEINQSGKSRLSQEKKGWFTGKREYFSV
ncbi:hypothetical protein [Pantoea osteomyelitidis]|uniref:hypothetical protein n=1 Tax=Pantoea osteomyelitidis TaxID=3230026 RepID=UPI0037C8ED25